MTITKEVWVDIKTIDNDFIAYKISNKGRICDRKGKICKCRGNRVNLLDRQGKWRVRAVSVLVAKAFNLEQPRCAHECYVHHKDGNIDNNRVDNLYWDEWRSKDQERKNAKHRRVVLTDEWYDRYRDVERRYGSIVNAPDDDPDWQWLMRTAQGVD